MTDGDTKSEIGPSESLWQSSGPPESQEDLFPGPSTSTPAGILEAIRAHCGVGPQRRDADRRDFGTLSPGTPSPPHSLISLASSNNAQAAFQRAPALSSLPSLLSEVLPELGEQRAQDKTHSPEGGQDSPNLQQGACAGEK